MHKLALALFTAGHLLVAQTNEPVLNGGWPMGSMRSADLIVIGDLTDPNASDEGVLVHCSGSIAPVRVVKGDLKLPVKLPVVWAYKPPMGMSAKRSLEWDRPTYGLWFLKSLGNNRFEPLYAGGPSNKGGAWLTLPKAELAGVFVFKDSDDVPTRVVSELGLAVATWAADAERRPNTFTEYVFETAADNLFYQAIGPGAKAAQIFIQFSKSSDPDLKAVGLAGRLRLGEGQAVFDLEAALNGLNAPVASRLLTSVDMYTIRDNIPALQALGRIMVNAPEAYNQLAGNIAERLAESRRPEVIPYLEAALNRPENGSIPGATAARSLCWAFRPQYPNVPAPPGRQYPTYALDQFWDASLQQNCPESWSLSQAARQVAFWKTWLTAHAMEIGSVGAGQSVATPSWYAEVKLVPVVSKTAPQNREEILGLLLQVLQTRVQMFQEHGKHAPQAEDIKSSLDQEVKLDLPDVAIFLRTEEQTTARFDEIDARLRHDMPLGTLEENSAYFDARKVERAAVLSAALTALKANLSAGGWSALDAYVQRLAH